MKIIYFAVVGLREDLVLAITDNKAVVEEEGGIFPVPVVEATTLTEAMVGYNFYYYL
jgi:hypothetical protein